MIEKQTVSEKGFATHTPTYEGYRGLFLERSGEDARRLAEVLIAPPEFPLNEREQDEVHEFDKDIFTHEISPGVTTESIIRTHKGEDTTAPLVFAEAFVQDVVTLTELPEEVRETKFDTAVDVYVWFAKLA